MLIMPMLMLSCIDAIDHADSVGRQSAQVDKVEVGWEFEHITDASWRSQRETISLIFFKIWASNLFWVFVAFLDSGRGHGVVAWGKFVASGGEIETVQLETPARRNSTWLKTPTACVQPLAPIFKRICLFHSEDEEESGACPRVGFVEWKQSGWLCRRVSSRPERGLLDAREDVCSWSMGGDGGEIGSHSEQLQQIAIWHLRSSQRNLSAGPSCMIWTLSSPLEALFIVSTHFRFMGALTTQNLQQHITSIFFAISYQSIDQLIGVGARDICLSRMNFLS